eukprot:TRINITY_DN3834_c2_g1_i1.p1 TRINITY_DN3834_c2_g1~~TRINITY_DN3834_c2_g1_i1.p1  ORF type:complete len:381 (-),score=94.63 TRINITY_DN3834_c2_g1_i1:152-1294(-)
MKRTAQEAFGGAGAAAAPQAAFAPSGTAMFDPKAYFNQFCQASATAQAAAKPAAAAAAAEEKTDLHKQVESLSCVRCAALVKEKGQNFTPIVAIEALCTMATKSSFKLREELIRQPHVLKLCKRVQDILAKPSGLDINTLARAAEALTSFPEEARGNAGATIGSAAGLLGTLQGGNWTADSAAKILHSLARGDMKGDTIMKYKEVVSSVVKELVRDQGRRVNDLSYQWLSNLLWAISKARQHKRQGDLQTVRMEDNDNTLFEYASKRIIEEIEQIDASLLAEFAITHHEIGIRDEPLFNAMCPKIVAKTSTIKPERMAKCIKAYCRFMIPLKEEAQGFRTMAVVQKGDFIRPSEKPRNRGPKTYEKPQALYNNTQVHSRG